MPRRLFIACNWKMNPIPAGALDENSPYHPQHDLDIVVFPTFLDLRVCIEAGITTGAQFGHPEERGAHTGDVSMAMLKQIGCQFVLCGHSERRQSHGETDEDVATQAKAAIEAGLHPVVCIGETEEERNAGKAEAIVSRQLQAILTQFSIFNSLPGEASPLGPELEAEGAKSGQFSIAYEPVWAIGTGKTATPFVAQKMHAFIRSKLPSELQDATRILYGGSMTPENAEELLMQPDIDGGLVGGASLDPEEFGKIIAIASVISES